MEVRMSIAREGGLRPELRDSVMFQACGEDDDPAKETEEVS